jgi:hypothetical protein
MKLDDMARCALGIVRGTWRAVVNRRLAEAGIDGRALNVAVAMELMVCRDWDPEGDWRVLFLRDVVAAMRAGAAYVPDDRAWCAAAACGMEEWEPCGRDRAAGE